jgi:hypothetical protein
MRAVSAMKAGLADRSTLPSGDPVTTTLLALTGMAADAESRVASRYGPDRLRRQRLRADGRARGTWTGAHPPLGRTSSALRPFRPAGSPSARWTVSRLRTA